MSTKAFFSTAVGALFFLLLFSKPQTGRCQAPPSTNEPAKKVVRIEVDSVIDTDGNVNAKRTIFIDGEEMPADFNWTGIDSNATVTQKKVIVINDGEMPEDFNWTEAVDADATGSKVVIINKEVHETTKKRRRKHQEPTVTKEVRVIEITEDAPTK